MIEKIKAIVNWIAEYNVVIHLIGVVFAMLAADFAVWGLVQFIATWKIDGNLVAMVGALGTLAGICFGVGQWKSS